MWWWCSCSSMLSCSQVWARWRSSCQTIKTPLNSHTCLLLLSMCEFYPTWYSFVDPNICTCIDHNYVCLCQEFLNPDILLFPYDKRESYPYRNFKRWVLPPPDPAPMTDDEKNAAAERRVRNPPLCKCGYRSEFVEPPIGLDYTPFFRCPITLSVIFRNHITYVQKR